MAFDSYSPCPCGSGKKFKWCCQAIFSDIEKAFQQDANGQHDAALRTLDELVQRHPDNPEAWGRKAQLLYQNDRVDEAESALQKSLELNPDYPFGHLLRGKFREHEGEVAGALIQFRKAAELYDPEAKDVLADLYMTIAESEIKMNRPVAARTALKLAMHCHPSVDDIRKSFETVFGENSHLPATARREFSYKSLPANADDAQKQRWERALSNAATGKLSDAETAFDEITKQDEANSAAWYNLGLTRAWLGDNHGALAAFDRYVALEPDEVQAGQAAALMEVLRCGAGMDDEANYIDYSAVYQIRDPRVVSELLQSWDGERRLVVTQSDDKQGFLAALVLEAGAGLAGGTIQERAIGAYLMIIVDHLRIGNVNGDDLAKIQQEMEKRVGPGLSPARRDQRPAGFNEIASEALIFPMEQADAEVAKRRIADHVQRFFEERWIQRPLRSLGMTPPIDAVGHSNLRKKVIGAVQFLQECAQPASSFDYDFDRLRRKLGLLGAGGTTTEMRDIGAMGAAELAALNPAAMNEEDLSTAYQGAIKLDARELAGKFARALIALPAKPDGADRFPWYSFLVNQALSAGDTDEALGTVNAGEKYDCESNEGRRRNEYELRRGQILAKRGETDEARRVFEGLIARGPAELKFRATAAETLLSARQAKEALKLAEEGLAEARKQNNRDLEEHFKELVSAATR